MLKRNALFTLLCLALAAACSKKGQISGTTPPPKNDTTASPPGDVVGKVIVGYQAWFAAPGDGSPWNGWWHWPGSVDPNYKAWPDMRQYTGAYPSPYDTLNDGRPSTLFSDWDQQTINTQFQWMQQNGIDGAALQRFNPNSPEGPIRDGITAKVKTAAETYTRKFYIMYDVTGWTNMETEIKTDWTGKMSAYTASSAYARQNGKPVVCIWGFGFNDANHPFSDAACMDVVDWFKTQGCYVIGGVPREWRTGTGGSRAGYLDVYHAFDMLSPWLIGAVGSISDADNIYTGFMVPDQADCKANGVDYQPCVLPGDLSLRQRVHGDLMWHMFYNATRAHCQGIYISMFDEFGEGNEIVATAETTGAVPSGTNILGLDEDGTACSADYYMRLTGDGDRMFKGQISLTSIRPTPPTLTPPDSVTTQALSTTAVQVNWTTVTEAPCYNVKRATVSGGPYTVIATNLSGGTYTDSGLTHGTTYYYVVSTGHINEGESADSGQANATP